MFSILKKHRVIKFYKNRDQRVKVFNDIHVANFKINGFTYHSVYQYYHSQRALAGGDFFSYQKVLNSSSPIEAIEYSNAIVNNTRMRWPRHRCQVIKMATYQKFRQNRGAARALLRTAGCLIANTSGWETFWSCGLTSDDPDSDDPDNWQGANMYGRILADVREELYLLGDAEYVAWYEEGLKYTRMYTYAEHLAKIGEPFDEDEENDDTGVDVPY